MVAATPQNTTALAARTMPPSKLGRLIVGGVALVAVGVGAVVGSRAWNAHRTSQRERAWGELSLCLLGRDPLGAEEAPSERVLRIKLGVLGVDAPSRTHVGSLPWPAVCAAPAYTVAERATETPVGAAAELLARALRSDTTAMADNSVEIDRLWSAAAQAGLKIGATTSPVEAPHVAQPLLSQREFQSLPRFLTGDHELVDLQLEPRSAGVVHFVLDNNGRAGGASLCSINAVDSRARCTRLPEAVAALSPGLRLIGATDDGARPLLFAGDHGQLGVFSAEGDRVPSHGRVWGAHQHRDGSATLLDQRPGAQEVHAMVSARGALALDAVALSGPENEIAAETTLVGDWFVWRSPSSSDQPHGPAHLHARPLGQSGLGAEIEIGSLQEPAPHVASPPDPEQLRGCQTPQALAVRARGIRSDHVSFYTSGRWSVPVKMTTHGGAFTCHGLEATSTVVDHGSDRGKDSLSITQAKCETSGCRTVRVDLRKVLAGLEILPIDAENAAAGDVGGQLLVVWNSGPVGGLRMRSGSAERYKDLDDVVIGSARDERGGVATSAVQGMRMAVADSFAVLFLATTSGFKVLRLHPSAKRVVPIAAGQ